MIWDTYIQEYEDYLKLERSLSRNSIEAYVHDVVKLKQFLEISNREIPPIEILSADLHNFIEYLHELGMSAYSQARIISGVKSFFKFLVYAGDLSSDPTALLETPKLGRKLPDTLEVHEIDQLLRAIDHSKPEGMRNRGYARGLV